MFTSNACSALKKGLYSLSIVVLRSARSVSSSSNASSSTSQRACVNVFIALPHNGKAAWLPLPLLLLGREKLLPVVGENDLLRPHMYNHIEFPISACVLKTQGDRCQILSIT